MTTSVLKPRLVIHLQHPRVACWSMTATQAEKLAVQLPEYCVKLCDDKSEFQAALPTAEIVITWHFRQEWLSLAPKLKILATPAAGKDYFTLQLPPQIQSWNGRFHGELIAETAVGALLGMCRGLFSSVSHFAHQAWPQTEISVQQTTLRNSRILILGFGRIGQWIGKQLKPFGARIEGMRRNLSLPPPDWFAPNDQIFSESELDAKLPQTDHLILCLPRSLETDQILDRRRINLLPPNATISNFGRGNAIATEALADALQQQRLKGAFLDVFPEEPLPEESPLRHCPKLWRLPHLSAVAPDYLDLFIQDFIRQYQEFQHPIP
ncbi:MAG: NAD(P)-dependent oxidoreductase [Lentisphaeria bacterium]